MPLQRQHAPDPSLGPFDFGLNVSNGFPIFTQQPDPATFAGTIQSQNLNFKQGRVQQFNLNVEQELPGSVVMTVGYAGSRSHHILVDGSNLNVASPTHVLPLSRPGEPRRYDSQPGFDPNYHLGCGIPAAPFGPFTTIANINDRGDARYDSLQVKAETKNIRHGLYVLLGYTYARNFDNGFNDGLGSSTGVTTSPCRERSKRTGACLKSNSIIISPPACCTICPLVKARPLAAAGTAG